jgi:hypothetical protein
LYWSAAQVHLLGTLLDLDGLERSKRAAGRAKDLLDIETIRALRRAR